MYVIFIPWTARPRYAPKFATVDQFGSRTFAISKNTTRRARVCENIDFSSEVINGSLFAAYPSPNSKKCDQKSKPHFDLKTCHANPVQAFPALSLTELIIQQLEKHCKCTWENVDDFFNLVNKAEICYFFEFFLLATVLGLTSSRFVKERGIFVKITSFITHALHAKFPH